MTKIFETDRLILREILETDAAFILDLLNQPTFIANIGDRMVRNLNQSKEYIKTRFTESYVKNGFGLLLVDLKSGEKPGSDSQVSIGICGFVKRNNLPEPDIGFAFLPEFEKNGYAFESANALMDYGKNTLKLKTVLAITTEDNYRSQKLLEKIGFTFDRIIETEGERLRLFSAKAETRM